ncbi:MAG: molybdenum cofactor biosynthesis protein MoaB [Candidatus Bathyarchaeota archaeon]|nr:molybdenum cofactor biosynthesis protein MoaB [Candidatus Bathyarchaeota archaeon]
MSHPRDQQIEADFALLVTSDSRTLEDDHTGNLAVSMLEAAGHNVIKRAIVPNDAEKIKKWILEAMESEASVIITSGGTGIGTVDVTVDTARGMFEKELPGFGEQFRRLSYDEVGVPGLMSRSTAGVIGKKLVFCLPGSSGAMRTALNGIILPGIGHMLWELSRR